MPSVEFWRPRLRGARFNDGQIPLQVLSDLTALREMVIDVAKWRYLAENPDRQRTPRGFADKIDLKLASIGEGSAVPVINITTDEPLLPGIPLPRQHFLEQARDAIAMAVVMETENGHVPDHEHLPVRFLAYFNRIGRSLRDGESLELPRANGSPPALLTTETRQRLLQRSTVREITRELVLRGTVPEADQERMTFELQPVHGGRVAGSIPEERHDVIIEAFNGYPNGVRVMVNGIGRYDRQGRLSSLDSIDQITLLDPLDVPARLDELRIMENGWLDGAGNAPSHQGLDWLSASFERYFPDDLPLPYIYPTPEGGVEAEWSLGAHSVIFEININTRQGDWLRFVKESDDDEDSRALNLDESTEWHWLTGEIRRFSEVAE